jgi:hypothetical protein
MLVNASLGVGIRGCGSVLSLNTSCKAVIHRSPRIFFHLPRASILIIIAHHASSTTSVVIYPTAFSSLSSLLANSA